MSFLYDNDVLWKSYAFKICGCKDLANDLVHDMYIKLHEKTEINKGYIYLTLKSLFIDHLRKNVKTISIDEAIEKRQIDCKTSKIDKGYKKGEVYESLSKLKWFDREILKMTSEYSLRACESFTGVNHVLLRYHKEKALNKLRKLWK